MSVYISKAAIVQPILPVQKTAPIISSASVTKPAAIQIAVINASTVVSDTQVRNLTVALQTQITRDFVPAWGIPADLTFFSAADKSKIPANYWWLVMLDEADVAGVLGYHDLTPGNQPLGKVFVKTSMRYGFNWTVTASHEVLEMLVDPYVNLTVFAQTSNTQGVLYAYEVCDAVQDEALGYYINNIQVSNFVYPAWFEFGPLPAGIKYDHRGKVTKAFEILKRGYMPAFRVSGSTTGWTQVLGTDAPDETRGSLRNSSRHTSERHLVISPETK